MHRLTIMLDDESWRFIHGRQAQTGKSLGETVREVLAVASSLGLLIARGEVVPALAPVISRKSRQPSSKRRGRS